MLKNTNQVAEYTFDGAGQIIKKITQTETRIFHYHGKIGEDCEDWGRVSFTSNIQISCKIIIRVLRRDRLRGAYRFRR